MSYKIKYKIEFGDFSKEELEKDDCGGCESLVLLSIMGEPLNGKAMSTVTIGVVEDGRPLRNDQIYEALLMAIQSLDNSGLSHWQVDLKKEMMTAARKARGIEPRITEI